MRFFCPLFRMKVLCVAEKPSISKAVADHLSGGNKQVVSPPAPLLVPHRRSSYTEPV